MIHVENPLNKGGTVGIPSGTFGKLDPLDLVTFMTTFVWECIPGELNFNKNSQGGEVHLIFSGA